MCDLRLETLTCHFRTVRGVLARREFIFCVGPQRMISSPKLLVSLLLQTSQVLVQSSYVTQKVAIDLLLVIPAFRIGLFYWTSLRSSLLISTPSGRPA